MEPDLHGDIFEVSWSDTESPSLLKTVANRVSIALLALLEPDHRKQGPKNSDAAPRLIFTCH